MGSEDTDSAAEMLSECTRVALTYKEARDIHIDSEAKTGERDWPGLVGFRDALDHMMKMIEKLDEVDIKGAKEELNRVEEHLERVKYDGKKVIPEQKISYIEKNRVPSFLYTLTLYEAPSSKEFKQRMQIIREKYSKGRRAFSENSASDPPKYLEEAAEIAIELEEDTPPKKDVYYRLITILGVLATVVAASYTILIG